MTASNFLACFKETESFEGGFVDNPHDPGGATLKGVTQAVYSAWLAHQGRSNAAVRGASDADIEAIYRAEYWNAVRGDDLYDGLDLVMVDTGWGSGPITAIKFLQRALGIEADGQFGVATLAAIKPHWNSQELIDSLCDMRMAFFQRLNTWKYFGVGWTARLRGIQARAIEMNKTAILPPLHVILNPGAGRVAAAVPGPSQTAATLPKGNTNMGFFTNLLNTARTVLTDVQTGAEAISPVAAAIPGAGTVVTAVEGAAAAANTAITAGEAIIAAASPEIAQLEALFDSLFHITPTPQATVLTPTTTAATTPAATT